MTRATSRVSNRNTSSTDSATALIERRGARLHEQERDPERPPRPDERRGHFRDQ